MQLRILKRKDGTEVLQEMVMVDSGHTDESGRMCGYAAYEWQDVPVVYEE